MPNFKLSTNATTAIVIIAGLAYLGFTFNRDPSSALAQLPLILGAIAGAIKLLHQGDATAAQSQQNGEQLTTLDAKVDTNTILTEQASENVDIIHKSVNSELEKWKQAVIDLWEERSKSLIADALAEGLRLGRLEMETSHQDTVIEAANVARVAAETATEAARQVVDAAATAAAVLVAATPVQDGKAP